MKFYSGLASVSVFSDNFCTTLDQNAIVQQGACIPLGSAPNQYGIGNNLSFSQSFLVNLIRVFN